MPVFIFQTHVVVNIHEKTKLQSLFIQKSPNNKTEWTLEVSKQF